MPRNPNESGDNGPIDGHEILHGTSGDKTLKHTKHVTPMPKPEKGEALPGMNASGGAAAPFNDASEEFGTNAPRNEQYGDDETTIGKSGNFASSNTRSAASASTGASKGSQQSSSGGNSSHNTHGFHKLQGKHDLESISREKAERYVNLNEEDVQHAGTANEDSDGAHRSSQRAPKEVGLKEDIEQLHSKATSSDHNKGQEKGSGNASGSGTGPNYGHSDSHKSVKQSSGQQIGGKGDSEIGGDGILESMRTTAKKFVNLEE
ncbi:hypothetical protein BDU57DRAFT_516929 [Ampelomyces quisqualis]|uniref:Uncharacterized protein n=1 Tax=Ampelomyces quisqualis TaxID=50730 RepID=A0A6A5QQ69_AMPQU|nr:hypothetical protein BDU57DRAFT_516929 [Ampelomyces quisqualis]